MSRSSSRLDKNKPAREVPSQDEQIEYFVKTAGRRVGVPVRVTFVQQGRGVETKPGPLASLVRARDERALDLYLLLLLLTARAPFDSTRDARLWARALGIAGPRSSGAAAVSKTWARLERRQLIARTRSGRLARVELRCEDGTGEAYVPPGEKGEQHFKIPVDYWTEGWYRRLKLPGKAALLIALSRPPRFTLPTSRAMSWYGISSDTLERGFKQLRDAEILGVRRRGRKAPEAPEGYVIENVYRLQPPFRRSTGKDR